MFKIHEKVEVYLECDLCKCGFKGSLPTTPRNKLERIEQLKQVVKEQGWTINELEVVCPSCNGK